MYKPAPWAGFFIGTIHLVKNNSPKHPANPIRGFHEFLKELYFHYGQGDSFESESKQLEYFFDLNPDQNAFALDLIFRIQNMEWHKMPMRSTLGPIRHLLVIFVDNRVSNLGDCFPLLFSRRLSNAGYAVHHEVEILKLVDCDLFLEVGMQKKLPPPTTFYIKNNESIVPGIPVECTACSKRNFPSKIKKTMKKFSQCGGGVLAIDVSTWIQNKLDQIRFQSRQEFADAVLQNTAVVAKSLGRVIEKSFQDFVRNENRCESSPLAAILVCSSLTSPYEVVCDDVTSTNFFMADGIVGIPIANFKSLFCQLPGLENSNGTWSLDFCKTVIGANSGSAIGSQIFNKPFLLSVDEAATFWIETKTGKLSVSKRPIDE